jgi:hypothetical protein
VPVLAARFPLLKGDRALLEYLPRFSSLASGDLDAVADLSKFDLEIIAAATLTGMTVEQFANEAKAWVAAAKDPRWKRPYTELTYLPVQEMMSYFRANGYKTYIVTGGGQDFVRIYANPIHGIPPEQVVGTSGGTAFGYAKDGDAILIKETKLLLDDDNGGKPEGIHLVIGRRRHQGRHLHAGPLRRSKEQRLVGHQHEERLEAYLRI